jgi:hypothetical protein
MKFLELESEFIPNQLEIGTDRAFMTYPYIPQVRDFLKGIDIAEELMLTSADLPPLPTA